MSVAYEHRSFIHEGAYPPIGEDNELTDADVAEHLSRYTNDNDILHDDRSIIDDDATVADDSSRLDLHPPGFSSPLPITMDTPPAMSDAIPDSNDQSPSAMVSAVPSPPLSAKIKTIPKPSRQVSKQADGKFHCPLEDCKEEVRAFARKCEWNKHMDKHERPYRCPAEGCENLPGFTYSGGLLRHEREVHGKHGGPKNTVNCPHPNCKRHTGKGFSRQENLNEHLRRVHTNPDGTTPPGDSIASPDDNDSERSGMKRKRRNSGHGADELTELREEIKRVREENDKLKNDMEQQTQHSLAMMAQIAELQETLRHGLGHHALGPTPQLI